MGVRVSIGVALPVADASACEDCNWASRRHLGTVRRRICPIRALRLHPGLFSMPHFRIRQSLVATAFALAVSTAAHASRDAVAEGEIDHLLQYVGDSSCTFVRNGDEYPAAKARDHLATKYRFVGERISTAEDFIRYLATGSSVSGEPYHVKCGKTDALSGAWLGDELRRYRKEPQIQAAR
jgi:hypothetical protein